jgi:hypothetical protein
MRIANLDMQLLILFAVFVWSATTVYIRNAHSKLGCWRFGGPVVSRRRDDDEHRAGARRG